MSDNKQEKLKSWLTALQQESWQLELIISGFAIFLIIGVAGPLNGLMNQALLLSLEAEYFNFLLLPIFCLKGAWFTLLLNLMIHLVMRGLWISTIGLRYVSEDIDFEHLRLARPFHNFLTRRIESFDRYIERLEKICSVIFAFSFLLIFIIFSISTFYLITRLFEILVLEPFSNNYPGIGSSIRTVINVSLISMGFIYLIDFLSLGRIKRIKWFSTIYYPIYRFMSWITFSSIYRPIYYNLIDNKFGRRVGLLIFPYILVAMVVSSLRVQSGKFFPQSSRYHLENIYYDSNWEEDRTVDLDIVYPSIPDKYVKNNYVEVFLPYLGSIDNVSLDSICPGLKPAKKERMLLNGAINVNFNDGLDYDLDSIMYCFGQLHRIRIDDQLIEEPDYLIYEHPLKRVQGFLSIIDIDTLSRGKHILSVEKYGLFIKGNLRGREWQEAVEIPFWKSD